MSDTHSQYARLMEARFATIAALAQHASRAVLQPVTGGGPRTSSESVTEAFAALLRGYEDAVRACHNSGSTSYAFRDLPEDEKRHYDEAKHAIHVLEKLYPRAVAAEPDRG